MRHFTRGWANGELTEDEARRAEEAYETRLREITPRLPAAVTRLLRGVSLHDALLESVRWSPAASTLELTWVAGEDSAGYHEVRLTYHGALLGPRRVESLRKAARDRETELLHQEVDLDEEGLLVHRLLFWPSEEVSLEFRELEYTSRPRSDRRVTLGGAFVEEEDDSTNRDRH